MHASALRAIIRDVGIADYEMVHRGFGRKELFGALGADARCDGSAVQLALPGVRQRAVHVGGDGEAVGGLPELRFVFEEGELERQVVRMLFDEAVHAAGVGFHDGARVFVHQADLTVGGAAKLHGAEVFVDRQGRFAEYLRELAAGDAAQQIHLPEAILGHDVALRLGQIFDGIGANVRDAPAVAVDGHFFLQTGQRRAAIQLRQRLVDQPPNESASENQNNPKDPKHNPQNRSQTNPLVKTNCEFRVGTGDTQPRACGSDCVLPSRQAKRAAASYWSVSRKRRRRVPRWRWRA